MQVEHRITIAAPAARIYSIYRDVGRWHEWDPDTKSATLDRPFEVGSRGRLTPTEGNAVPMVLTAVKPDQSFTVECKLPFFRMVFEHELEPNGKGTEVIHRITLAGLLSIVLWPILSKRLNVGLPVTLRSLKALAEAKRQV
jgi:Polyketide cyclase / dehydrase and lipid transport